MFKQLLQVKQLREQRARLKVKTCIQEYEAAIQTRDNAEKELTDYTLWRYEEEQRLFEKMQNKPVQLTDVDKFNQNVGLLRQKDVQLQQLIVEAKNQCQKTFETLNQARMDHAQSMKSEEKMTELNTQHVHQIQQQTLMKEETEQEELVYKRNSY